MGHGRMLSRFGRFGHLGRVVRFDFSGEFFCARVAQHLVATAD